jgi:hypothetical protein
MDFAQSRTGKRARRSANDALQAFHRYWLGRFEKDNERFFEQVTRLADGTPYASPEIAPAE